MHLDKGIQPLKKGKIEIDLPVFHTNGQCETELSKEEDKRNYNKNTEIEINITILKKDLQEGNK